MSDDYRELLLGCGHARDKHLWVPADEVPNRPATDLPWVNLTTCDNRKHVKPDVLVDLDSVVAWPWKENTFNEVHAYEVVEHLGGLGQERAFFRFFERVWQVLVPGGFFCATCPSRYSQWLWGDPGHKRAILPCTLSFLNQPWYGEQRIQKTDASDYRDLWRGDFDIRFSEDDRSKHRFILQAVKPARLEELPA